MEERPESKGILGNVQERPLSNGAGAAIMREPNWRG